MADAAFLPVEPTAGAGAVPGVPPAVPPQAQPAVGLGALMQPGAVQQGPPPQTPQELQQRTAEWEGFLGNPSVSAALMQFGMNMLQPRQYNQSVLGQVGQAAGAAGEAVARVADRRLAHDQLLNREKREDRRAAVDERRAAVDERRAATDEQRAQDDKQYRKEMLELQRMELRIRAANAGGSGAAASVARDRLQFDKEQAEKELEFKRDKLAQDWLKDNLDRADKQDAALLSQMIRSAFSVDQLPGTPPPSIEQIGQEFKAAREVLKTQQGETLLTQLGTEAEWRRMLSDPALTEKATKAFGANVVEQARKKYGAPTAGTP